MDAKGKAEHGALALQERGPLKDSGNALGYVWFVPDAVYQARLQCALAKLLEQVCHAETPVTSAAQPPASAYGRPFTLQESSRGEWQAQGFTGSALGD